MNRPLLRYHGSKWRLAPWIIGHFPPHKTYVEAFGGGGAVIFRKPRTRIEVYNDLDGDMVTLFRVLQDPRTCAALARQLEVTPYARQEFVRAHEPATDPVERARRVVIRAGMGFGSNAVSARTMSGFRGNDWKCRKANNLSWLDCPEIMRAAHARLQGVIIEDRPAMDLIEAQDSPETLFYLDPPYVSSTRSNFQRHRSYKHEMDDSDHRAMAAMVKQVRGFVVLSGYHSPLYDDLFGSWPHVETQSRTQGNALTVSRTEVLWMSPRTRRALRV